MSDLPEPVTVTADSGAREPRSSGAVLAILGGILAVPILVLLVVLLFNGTGEDSGADNVTDGIRSDRIQAVYMANDRVFFGDLEGRSGDWLELKDAFYLRRSAAEDGKDGQEAGSTDLVPLAQEVGGDGDMLVNAREIVLVQNLATDSPIAESIQDASKP